MKIIKSLCMGAVLALSAFAGAESNWSLMWSDEFNYAGLPDSDKWFFEHGPDWPNGELQYYTNNRVENGRVENGVLVIEARQEQYQGKQYTSARLLSHEGFTYGRMEIRAKLTSGIGLWPAIWMFPKNEIYGYWPLSGEIDIMENWSWDANGIYGTVHTEDYNHINHTEKQGRIEFPDLDDAFHVYAIEWYEDQIRWFVDDTLFFTLYNEGTTSSYPFNHPFHFILNVAVEGNSPGNEGTWTKRTMEVDYVRVFSGPLQGPALPVHDLPGTLEAEDYFDARGVRNENNTTGKNVGYIDPNDWMDYKVNATGGGASQSFTTRYRVSSPAGGKFELRNGNTLLETITVPATGGWQAWQDVAGSITLPADEHTLRLFSVTGGFNIDRVEFEGQVPATLVYPCTASAQSVEQGFPASNVCDGNTSSRWSSDWNDSQWIMVDLGSVKPISEVELTWEAAYGKVYNIQVSSNGNDWQTIVAETNGNGGVDTYGFTQVEARYVRIQGVQRGTSYGYSLYSFDVSGDGGSDGPTNPSTNPPAQPPEGNLAIRIEYTNDWGQGYCADLFVTNNGTNQVNWNVNAIVEGTLTTSWNANYTQTGSTINVWADGWNKKLAAGETRNVFGFCADR